jgi:transmembrane sensor
MNNQDPKQELGPIQREAVFWYWHLQDSDTPVSDWPRFREWNAIPEHRAAFDAMAAVWEDASRVRRESQAIAAAPQRTRSRVSRVFLRAAVVLLIVAILGPSIGPSIRILETDATARTWVLDDGSVVRAAPGARLKIESGTRQRSSYLLRGQAFFRVAEDRYRPFVVSTPLTVAQALGTRFGVSYVDRESVVTVVEGTVAVSPVLSADVSARAVAPVKLHARQQIRVSPLTFAVVPDVDSEQALAWATTIRFAGTPIDEAVEQFNRLNGSRLEFAKPRGAPGLRISGAFQLDPPETFAQYIADETSTTVLVHLPGSPVRQVTPRVTQP